MVSVHETVPEKVPGTDGQILLYNGTGFREWAAALSLVDLVSESVGRHNFKRKLSAWLHTVLADKDSRHGDLVGGAQQVYQLHCEIYYKMRKGFRVTTDYEFPKSAHWLTLPIGYADELPVQMPGQVAVPTSPAEDHLQDDFPF